MASGSVLVWPLTVRIQGNKKFRKQTAWTQKGRLAAFGRFWEPPTALGFPWTRTLCRAQSSWLRSLASPGASTVFSASLARSCSVSCSLVGMEFFFGLPLGLVGDSRPPPCSTCEGDRRRCGELAGDPGALERQAGPGEPNEVTGRPRLAPRKWWPFVRALLGQNDQNFSGGGFKSSRNTESSGSKKGAGPGHRKEAELGHPEGQRAGRVLLGTRTEGIGSTGRISPRWRGEKLLKAAGAWRQTENTENREDTYYFLPLHPSILVPRLNLQLAQTQGLGEIYSGKSGVHPQQGMQPPSHYPLGPAWPRATCPAWRGTSASQSVSLGPSAAAR